MYKLLFSGVLITLSVLVTSFTYAEKKESPQLISGSTKVNAEQVIETAELHPQLVIIDSRIVNDRQQGYIPDSISLPDEETNCDALSAYISKLGAPVLFYCNGPKCGRSGKSVGIALGCGYYQVYWFRGGIEEWKNKGYPLTKD